MKPTLYCPYTYTSYSVCWGDALSQWVNIYLQKSVAVMFGFPFTEELLWIQSKAL